MRRLRKNYLLGGPRENTQRAAMMRSFLEICKKNDVEPFTWLRNVLTKIPEHQINKLEELLPATWKLNK